MERGWLLPYLFAGDFLFLHRWDWWLNSLLKGEIRPPIPKITWSYSREARKNIENAINILSYRSSNPFHDFVDWLLWSLYPFPLKKELEPNVTYIGEKEKKALYKEFVLGLMQQHPWDYIAEIAPEYVGGQNGFFPTPMNVTEMMAQMSFSVKDEDVFQTVYDPAGGTGSLLLAASNFSIFLYYSDINPLMCKCFFINSMLYAPWVVLSINPKQEEPKYEIPVESKYAALYYASLYTKAVEEMKTFARKKHKQPEKPSEKEKQLSLF